MQLSDGGEQQQGDELKHDDIQNLRSSLHCFPGIMSEPLQKIKSDNRIEKHQNKIQLTVLYFFKKFHVAPRSPFLRTQIDI